MRSKLSVILGAGGEAGNALACELTDVSDRIRLVSRTPEMPVSLFSKPLSESDRARFELFGADLTDSQRMNEAVADADLVYLTAGLAYKTGVWRETWPRIMQNTIDACKTHRARLVFLDNVYMYDCDSLSRITEETPVNPCSAKGKVRVRIAQMIQDEVASGALRAIIARSADFAGIRNSLTGMICESLSKGKAANWLLDADKRHNFTFIGDIGKALALLGHAEEEHVWNRVWHLPTDTGAPTGRQWVELIARKLGVEPKISVVGSGMLTLLGVFVPMLRELKEMGYQYDRDYLFDGSQFEKHFSFEPATPERIVDAVVAAFKRS